MPREYRRSPGIIGIAFAVFLGLCLFVVCAPICIPACAIGGIAGLAGLIEVADGFGKQGGAAPLYDGAEQVTRAKRNEDADNASDSPPADSVTSNLVDQTLQVMRDVPSSESEIDYSFDNEGDAESESRLKSNNLETFKSDMMTNTERCLAQQDQVNRRCPDSVISSKARDELINIAVDSFDVGLSRREVLYQFRVEAQNGSFEYNESMRPCISAIISLAQMGCIVRED